MASATQTITLRLPTTLLERIDHSAQRAGQTRNTYLLSWLPDYYDQPTEADRRTTRRREHAASG